jgi:hypothetical protein
MIIRGEYFKDIKQVDIVTEAGSFINLDWLIEIEV